VCDGSKDPRTAELYEIGRRSRRFRRVKGAGDTVGPTQLRRRIADHRKLRRKEMRRAPIPGNDNQSPGMHARARRNASRCLLSVGDRKRPRQKASSRFAFMRPSIEPGLSKQKRGSWRWTAEQHQGVRRDPADSGLSRPVQLTVATTEARRPPRR
jgi:hypothetical protein